MLGRGRHGDGRGGIAGRVDGDDEPAGAGVVVGRAGPPVPERGVDGVDRSRGSPGAGDADEGDAGEGDAGRASAGEVGAEEVDAAAGPSAPVGCEVADASGVVTPDASRVVGPPEEERAQSPRTRQSPAATSGRRNGGMRVSRGGRARVRPASDVSPLSRLPTPGP